MTSFDSFDRMSRSLRNMPDQPPRSPMGSMANNLREMGSAPPPQSPPRPRPTPSWGNAATSPEAAAWAREQAARDAARRPQPTAPALANRAGSTTGQALRDAKIWAVGDRPPATSFTGKARNFGGGRSTQLGASSAWLKSVIPYETTSTP